MESEIVKSRKIQGDMHSAFRSTGAEHFPGTLDNILAVNWSNRLGNLPVFLTSKAFFPAKMAASKHAAYENEALGKWREGFPAL